MRLRFWRRSKRPRGADYASWPMHRQELERADKLRRRMVWGIVSEPDYGAVDRALRRQFGVMNMTDATRAWREQPRPAGLPAIDRGAPPLGMFSVTYLDPLDDPVRTTIASDTVAGESYDPDTDSWAPTRAKDVYRARRQFPLEALEVE